MSLQDEVRSFYGGASSAKSARAKDEAPGKWANGWRPAEQPSGKPQHTPIPEVAARVRAKQSKDAALQKYCVWLYTDEARDRSASKKIGYIEAASSEKARALAEAKYPAVKKHGGYLTEEGRAQDGLVHGYTVKGTKELMTPAKSRMAKSYVLIHNGNQVFGPDTYSACEQKSMSLSRGPQDKFRIVEETRAKDEKILTREEWLKQPDLVRRWDGRYEDYRASKEAAKRDSAKDADPTTVIIPSGVGYNVEFGGNITGDFARASENITAKFEQYHGQQVIFRLPNGKRGMTRKDLVEIK